MSRVPAAGYLNYISKTNWDLAFMEAHAAIQGLQEEVRQRNPEHPLLGLVAATEEGIEFTPEFDRYAEQHIRDEGPSDTLFYRIGRYIERLGLVLA